jgi:hypothetical protein
VSAPGDAGELLATASGLLRRADPDTAGLWPRASALLALQALEASLAQLWRRHDLAFRSGSLPTQLICLRSYLDQAPLAARAGHAWSALRRACHHHPYELAPTAAELESWLGVVEELAGKVAAA